MAGLVANRWNTTLLAFTEPLSENPPVTDPLVTAYSPAWTEWAATFAIVALLAMIFSLGMRFLPSFRGISYANEVEPSHAEIVAFPETARQHGTGAS